MSEVRREVSPQSGPAETHLMQLQGMSASGSVSEHDSEPCTDRCSGNQTKHGSAGDRWRASYQHKAAAAIHKVQRTMRIFMGVLPTAVRCRYRHWLQVYSKGGVAFQSVKIVVLSHSHG
jgi:hypothetical protein